MPTNTESLNRELFRLLSKYKPKPLDAEGKSTPIPDEADIFKFEFTKDGEDYGTVYVTLDEDRVLTVYFGDDVADSPDEKTPKLDYDDTWSGLLHQLSAWRMTKGLKGFDTQNKDRVGDDMARRNHMRNKDKIAEGYYATGKKSSYSDAVPSVKIVIEHSRVIEEGEQRYRNINRIFLENQAGERYLLDTKKPGIARVYARHIAEGGKVNDDRWSHIGSLCEEYQKMAGFVRATRNGQFNESAQSLVNEGIAHYASLRESLSRMTGKRGYNAYFESWTPSLMEDGTEENNLNELFVQETLDPRIESVMPILNRIHKKVSESAVDKEMNKLAEWADSLSEEGGESLTSNNPIGIPEEKDVTEGHQVVPGIDREKYTERPGLEGPFSTKSGKVVYYDKQEGKYYDPGTDFYISHDDYQAMNEQGVAEGSKIPMVKDSETGKKHPDYGNTRMMRDLAAAAQKRKSQPPTEPNSNDLSTYNDFPDTNKHPWMPVMIGEPSWANIPKSLEIWARRKGIHRDIDISHDPEGKIWTIRGKSGYPHDTEYTYHWEYDYDHNQFEPVEQGVTEGTGSSIERILAAHPEAVENFKQGGDLDYDLESDLWEYYFNNGEIRNYDADASEFISQRLADELGLSEGLDANQKRVGQLGPTEKVKNNNIGKLVGANENFINTVDQAVVSEEDEVAESILSAIKKVGKKVLDKVAPGDEELLKQLDKDAHGGKLPNRYNSDAESAKKYPADSWKVKVDESEERSYVCVHAKKGKCEVKASSSYAAAQKAAQKWGLKGTAGIDAHLADVEKDTSSLEESTDELARILTIMNHRR